MFRLSSDHLTQFSRYMYDRLHATIKDQLRDRWMAERGIEHETSLDSFVTTTIRKAADYHIVYAADQARYVDMCFQFPLLRTTPRAKWIEEILSYPGRTGATKLQILQAQINARTGTT